MTATCRNEPTPESAQTLIRGSRPDTCTVVGCDDPHLARGYCSRHWQRVYKHGDLSHERAMPAGPEHHRWSGGSATYGAVHQRLRYQRGAASRHPCLAGCGDRAAHWAYDNADPGELACPKLGCRYSTALTHYVPMCVPCHKAFDLAAT